MKRARKINGHRFSAEHPATGGVDLGYVAVVRKWNGRGFFLAGDYGEIGSFKRAHVDAKLILEDSPSYAGRVVVLLVRGFERKPRKRGVS